MPEESLDLDIHSFFERGNRGKSRVSVFLSLAFEQLPLPSALPREGKVLSRKPRFLFC